MPDNESGAPNSGGNVAVEAKLNDKDIRLITFIDQKFWETGSIVSDEVILNFFPEGYVNKSYLGKFWKNDLVRRNLAARGVRLAADDDLLGMVTPKQAVAASMMMNLADKRSDREKLKEVGVTTQQWQGWLREPGFQGYLKKRAEHLFGSSDPEAYRQLAKKVSDGDFNALKLHFEMRGIYNPKVDVNINVQQVLVHVVEIVAKHVGDPEILEAIATDLETLPVGGSLDAMVVEAAARPASERMPVEIGEI